MEWLKMKYHPAKKEIEFHRYRDDEEVVIESTSRLMQYMNEKGTFVLQDHGNAFFDNIAYVFDGQDSVDIQVTTTKLDYEDLVQMVNMYNAQSENCKINLTSLIELPNMETTYLEVKKCGEQAIDALESHCHNLYRIEMEGDKVKESADNFASKIHKEIQNIRGKINDLSDNRVNLCFAGVYSAGKSALINAILGYRILPESIESKTAKMFRIFSPKPGENIKISFKIQDVPSEIEWNESDQCFDFSKGPSENTVRAKIQKVINDVKEAGISQHEQIYKILWHLNGCKADEVSSEIMILFPVPLDSEKVQFAIYDTPGTDSNYEEHKKILDEALKEQSHSILIFVVKPDGLEGEGNNILLDYLKEAEKNDGKTCIDLNRSIFVINKADTVTADTRITLQGETIKSKTDDSLSIKLSDKKLFFVSAVYGYAARAVSKGIATEEDEEYFDEASGKLRRGSGTKFFFYRQNRCATSDYSTQRMHEKCETALHMAQESGDETTALSVGAGLYALEQEILQYGEKYAAAVKAYAIIESINGALTRLADDVTTLRQGNQQEIAEIEKDIDQLGKTLKSAINKAYQSRLISPDKVPEKISQELQLDSKASYNVIIKPIKDALDETLQGWFLGIGKVKIKEDDKKIIGSKINKTFQAFSQHFFTVRRSILAQQGMSFMAEVKQAISDNGEIGDSAKKYFLSIPNPSINELKLTTNVNEIFDSYKRTRRVLLVFKRNFFDKDGFIRQIEELLSGEAERMRREYLKDYCHSLNALTQKVTADFNSRLNEYSLTMKALLQDRDAMEAIGDRMHAAADELDICLGQLNQIIWKEKQNV